MDEKWSKAEITKAARIILGAHIKKSLTIKILDEIIHWLILLLILVGNIVFSTILIFTYEFIGGIFFNIILIILASAFGFMVEIPIADIKKLDKNKHFMIKIMLPIFTLINVYLIYGIITYFERFTQIELGSDPINIGLLYGLFFILPHFVGNFINK